MAVSSVNVRETFAERTGPSAWPRPAYAWYVVIIVTVAYAFAILDRIAIGLLVDPMKKDLHISDTQISLLQGLAFAICYTLFGLPIGYFMDRSRRVPLLALGIAVWSGATVVCGLARSFTGLFLARIGVGVGEASITPGASSLIGDYFPPERRGKAFGVFMLGSSLGTGLSYMMTALAIVVSERLHNGSRSWFSGLHTWQIAFILIGLPGLLISALFVLTVREPARQEVSTKVGRGSLGGTWAQLKAERGAYATLILGAVLCVTAIYASLGWMPSLYIRVHHWTPAKVGSVVGLVSLPIGMSGALIAGWTMSWLTKRGRRDAPILMILGHAVTVMVLNTSAALAPRPEMVIALNAAGAVTSTWAYAAALTGINQITPNEQRGQFAAFYTLCTGLISMTLGTLLVGLLSDHVFTGPTGVSPSLATVFAGCGLLGAIVLLIGRKSFERAVDRAETWEAAS